MSETGEQEYYRQLGGMKKILRNAFRDKFLDAKLTTIFNLVRIEPRIVEAWLRNPFASGW
ncbi:MAG: hypothetical protein E5W70_05580 [Mesorhizobium sp.]|uniref:hypothetical protein n=1 Tax=Mesorhizobium sp. TaxID=1871066 RepID=UPI00120F5E76|nr:hypothetical protein [Mesorhizobium sp.]TIT23982.1 MAG: hypothetical protein E5W70_05580 [Mesorhizobium sp.]